MRDAAKMPARRRNAVDLVQLQPGDLVVHEQHGIGRYIEMISRTVNGGQRDYLIVEYAPSRRNQPPDRLFVPTDSLDQLTRYVGGEAPALSKLGGADWKNTKSKARKAVKQIAAELIRLYSARMATQGARLRPGHRLAARARGRLPVPGDARPARRHRRGQGRHDAAGPDGPDHLRRRRLREDRDRDPGGVQGGAGRQAGRRPRADDAAGQPALQDLLRAVRPVPGDGRRALPVPVEDRERRDRAASWPPARSTSWSAPTGCCSRPPGSRTSAW